MSSSGIVRLTSTARLAANDYGTSTFVYNAEKPSHVIEQELLEQQRKANFTVNLGHVIETLREDVPVMFELPPCMDIYCKGVILKDPKGVITKGRRTYSALLASLRALTMITGMHPRVEVQRISYDEPRKSVEVRLAFFVGAPFRGEPIELDALAHYKLDLDGFVHTVEYDNLIKRDLWDFSTANVNGFIACGGP